MMIMIILTMIFKTLSLSDSKDQSTVGQLIAQQQGEGIGMNINNYPGVASNQLNLHLLSYEIFNIGF
jgi:hypothetical protein